MSELIWAALAWVAFCWGITAWSFLKHRDEQSVKIIAMVFLLVPFLFPVYCVSEWRRRRKARLKSRLGGLGRGFDPHWEVRPAHDNDELIGYRVRWSEPDGAGRYLWVRHYLSGEDGSPSLGWCERAASRDAAQMNEAKRMPSEFPAYHFPRGAAI